LPGEVLAPKRGVNRRLVDLNEFENDLLCFALACEDIPQQEQRGNAAGCRKDDDQQVRETWFHLW